MFNAFAQAYAVAFCTKHGQNKIRNCDIKGFVPVASLNGVVRFPSVFMKSLIGSTGKIRSDLYINVKLI